MLKLLFLAVFGALLLNAYYVHAVPSACINVPDFRIGQDCCLNDTNLVLAPGQRFIPDEYAIWHNAFVSEGYQVSLGCAINNSVTYDGNGQPIYRCPKPLATPSITYNNNHTAMCYQGSLRVYNSAQKYYFNYPPLTNFNQMFTCVGMKISNAFGSSPAANVFKP